MDRGGVVARRVEEILGGMVRRGKVQVAELCAGMGMGVARGGGWNLDAARQHFLGKPGGSGVRQWWGLLGQGLQIDMGRVVARRVEEILGGMVRMGKVQVAELCAGMGMGVAAACSVWPGQVVYRFAAEAHPVVLMAHRLCWEGGEGWGSVRCGRRFGWADDPGDVRGRVEEIRANGRLDVLYVYPRCAPHSRRPCTGASYTGAQREKAIRRWFGELQGMLQVVVQAPPRVVVLENVVGLEEREEVWSATCRVRSPAPCSSLCS